MHPLNTNNNVCYVLGEIYFTSEVGMVYCLNKKDGTPHFSVPFDGPLTSKPKYIKTSDNEYIFVVDLNGKICSVDIKQKEKSWCISTSKKDFKGKSFASLEYDEVNKVLWFASMKNGIFALDPLDGKIISQWLPSKENSILADNYAAVTIDENHLYQMDIEGNLRLFNIKKN